jgi:hypothetical protein
MLKMEKKIIISGLFIFFLMNYVAGGVCDPDQIDHYVNTSQFDNAALCSDQIGDYDNAIIYTLKSIELAEEAGRNTSLSTKHLLIAKYYSKKGNGFENQIREHCDLAETLLLQDIDYLLSREQIFYSSIHSDYGSLATCYNLIDDKEKSCNYCAKSNEYRIKDGELKPQDCSRLYGCPKASPDFIPSESSSNASGGFPILYLTLGGGIILILLAALFLPKKKKK